MVAAVSSGIVVTAARTCVAVALSVVAFAVRLLPGIVSKLIRGQAPPPYEAQASLGAQLLDGYEDVFIESAGDDDGGVRVHAVVDDTRLRKSDLPPVVFVHGFPEHWLSWERQMEHMRRKGHMVVRS